MSQHRPSSLAPYTRVLAGLYCMLCSSPPQPAGVYLYETGQRGVRNRWRNERGVLVVGSGQTYLSISAHISLSRSVSMPGSHIDECPVCQLHHGFLGSRHHSTIHYGQLMQDTSICSIFYSFMGTTKNKELSKLIFASKLPCFLFTYLYADYKQRNKSCPFGMQTE